MCCPCRPLAPPTHLLPPTSPPARPPAHPTSRLPCCPRVLAAIWLPAPSSKHGPMSRFRCPLLSPQGRLPEPGNEADAAAVVAQAKAINEAASDKV